MLIPLLCGFSGRKFICGITSKLLQIHQETLWRRPKNISNVALHHYQEGYHESKMLPVLDCCDYAGHLSIVTLKLR
jgi:hypothetical protein